ncbi:hypothetical protein [Candidatus Uabimicrobium amorphum]|uniref:Uncharacterized protein n=1 Tax=Uabimicrobium amorphum TaxID=2596890 RepID=A0A5S9IU71_UABAM|nr:hypothetical protein [Candidatus Uabimicrobium amorphum]BBM86695.1 hypothetical protein UABAM_05081 [Candidatus Uabimicrobium amorphum]
MEENKVNVEFYEFTSKQLFANSQIPLEQLPDSFAINTTIHFGDSDWKVMAAQPLKKSEFAVSGKVELFLSKVETMDPKNILYSLPSINDELPNVVEQQGENVLVLLEDDWRQAECVSTDFLEQINVEIEQIRDIYKNDRESSGFRNMHLRKKITAPLEGKKIVLEDLYNHFKCNVLYDGVGFNTSHGAIENGFAFSTAGNWIFWGQIGEQKSIAFLNVIAMANAIIEPFSSQMDQFLKDQGLYVVDWTRMLIVGDGQSSFDQFMTF